MTRFSITLSDTAWAMSLRTRALAYGQAALRCLGSDAASIAIAVFLALYFAWEFTR